MEKLWTHATMSLSGKRVVVIGGASGIGFAVAKLSRELGAEVVIGSNLAADVEAAIARLEGATGKVVDVLDEVSVSQFFEDLGAFDHLAITAGDWGVKLNYSTQEVDLVASREAFGVRFWGALAAVKHGSRFIVPGGSMTLTSGWLSHRPKKTVMIAAALGGAVECLVRGLAIDLAPVRVNCVCPGTILTEIVKKMPEQDLKKYTAHLPLPRGALPAEAAMAYVYSMLNGYITGHILPVDGGGGLV